MKARKMVTVAGVLLLVGFARGDPQYTLVDLGVLEGNTSTALAINDRSEIAGYSNVDLGFGVWRSHPVFWDENRVLHDIGVPVDHPDYGGRGEDINNFG